MAKCSSCGATISKSDQFCPYCGAQNPGYQPSVDDVNALLEKGAEAFQQKQYVLAIDCYRQVIALDPNVFSAYFYLATCLADLGREGEAIEVMKRAQKLRPGNTAVYYNLALLSKRAGQKQEAQGYLQQALKVLGSDVSLQNRKQMKQNINNLLAELE
ncbi:MAG: tetratricopeptide repeat protein [Chloroflexi bacterium]|nr:tetratricopeptide repeat protein [Chloroflexota bacterium]